MRDALLVLGGALFVAFASWVISMNLWPVVGIAALVLVAGFFVFGPALIDGIWSDE